jgi:hypothetical protein
MLEQERSIEITQYLQDHPQITHWVAVDDLNMGIPQVHESWGDMEMDWGLSNFVLTTRRTEGIKQSGIKEKILAAKRAGIQTVIMCKDNQKDVDDIPAQYLKGLSFHYVSNMLEVLDFALLEEKVAKALDLTVVTKA